MYVIKATLDHLPDMLHIQKQCYAVELQESDEVFESIIKESDLCYVMVEKNYCIGYLLAHYWDDLESPPMLHANLENITEKKCIFIHDLAIHTSFQKQGLADTLLSKLDKNNVYSLVSVNNSEKFWNKYGFSIKTSNSNILNTYCDKDPKYMIANKLNK